MITREVFNEVFESVFGDNGMEFLNRIAEGFSTSNYKGFLHDDTVFIIDLLNEELITWYKLTHIGRSLKITDSGMTKVDLTKLFAEIKGELEL